MNYRDKYQQIPNRAILARDFFLKDANKICKKKKKINWYMFRNMSGTYLSPIGWYKYCNKNGWNHLGYVITWHLFRKHFYYSKNKLIKFIGAKLGYKSRI